MNIFEKLSVIQQELIVPKNQWNDYGKYNYRSCEDILEGLKPCLEKVKALVTLTDELVHIGERYYVKATATFHDCESSEKISNTAYAREDETLKGMNGSQITGGASSYARKYALNGLFCIDDEKDVDSKDNRQNDAEEQKKAAEEEKKIAASRISDIKAKNLLQRCENEKMDVVKLTTLYKVKSLEELTEKQFRHISDNWEKLKVM